MQLVTLDGFQAADAYALGLLSYGELNGLVDEARLLTGLPTSSPEMRFETRWWLQEVAFGLTLHVSPRNHRLPRS